MKKTIFTAISFFIVLFSTFTASAQDVIHRKNGKTLEVKIVEVGDVDVKYKLFTQPDGATYVMDASLVKKIVFANGAIHKFEEGSSMENTEYYAGQSKNLFKISFLAWTVGYTSFGYEHSMKPGRSFEARLGAVGLGKNLANENQRGLVATFGYKFINVPDYRTARQHYAHLLHGGYIRPEVSVGSYGIDTYIYNGTNYNTKGRAQVTSFCFMLSGGKQWIIEKFAIDSFIGIGIGGVNNSKNKSTTYYTDSVPFATYSNYILPNNVAFNLGLNIGFLGKK